MLQNSKATARSLFYFGKMRLAGLCPCRLLKGKRKKEKWNSCPMDLSFRCDSEKKFQSSGPVSIYFLLRQSGRWGPVSILDRGNWGNIKS
jgi:hypothetical protein